LNCARQRTGASTNGANHNEIAQGSIGYKIGSCPDRLRDRPMHSFMSSRTAIATFAAMAALWAGVANAAARDGIATEAVLNENVRLTAQLPEGRVSIVSGPGLQRTFEWGGCSLTGHMFPRARRWFGSLGLYDPGASTGEASISPSCNGLSRTVAGEAQIHFADEDSAARGCAGTRRAGRPCGLPTASSFKRTPSNRGGSWPSTSGRFAWRTTIPPCWLVPTTRC